MTAVASIDKQATPVRGCPKIAIIKILIEVDNQIRYVIAGRLGEAIYTLVILL
jgi:hypothetical protein